MLIASYLKNTNIAEYLLYMWQVEDTIRAMDFDIDRIEKSVVDNLPFKDEDERRTVLSWYEDLIDMMRRENVMDKGHLQLNINTVADLDDFHYLVLGSERVPAYNAKYLHVLPLINQLRQKSESGLTDVELCFNFQYGILMLRLQKKEISADTLKTQEEISKFLVLLTKNYHAFAEGKLDLE
jgi:hypothetical protein